MCVLQWVSENKTSCVWPWYVIRVMGASAAPVCATRERWDITRKPIPLTYLSNFLLCKISYNNRFFVCPSPYFMWWWCLKFGRKCSLYKSCNGWVDPSLESTLEFQPFFLKSTIIVITPWLLETFFRFCSINNDLKGKPQYLKMFSITKSKTPEMRVWQWHILMIPFVRSTYKFLASTC